MYKSSSKLRKCQQKLGREDHSQASVDCFVVDLQDVLERSAFDNICKVAFNHDPALIPRPGHRRQRRSRQLLHRLRRALSRKETGKQPVFGEMKLLFLAILSVASSFSTLAQQCGRQAGEALCPDGLCCSQYGYCGSTEDYCGKDCQSQCRECGQQTGGVLCAGGLCCSRLGYCGSTPEYCGEGCQSQCDGGPTPTPPPPSPGGGGVDSIITSSLFEQMLLHRNDPTCEGHGFYTYDAFVAVANSFSGFGTTGDNDTRKREIAAFLAQTSHETTGGWPEAPDGPYAWGYCYVTERNKTQDYCKPSSQWPCAPGKKYYGRGPIQISYNYNYGQAGEAIGQDLLNNPDLVAADAVVSFKTALWFWMTPQPPKPSCHDVITDQWTPSPADQAAGRLPGYGVITNIINGGVECGRGGPVREVEDRIGFYKKYCDMLGVSYGDNLDCYSQKPFGFGSGFAAES
ncbi:Glycoside hydrolase, family 19, catalytic [Canna indica]|uniref:chitinase n=1 Tax=Canna indica TaxID=4628 RepID=A0AAQ3KAM6_9LILI|nr:Glycoside hydrolase, family 19, catalytic [Canna indica]